MALSKDQKTQVVTDVADLLSNSKMTVVAQYQGLTVKSMQALRKEARNNGTTVRVVKNRLVRQALSGVDTLKDVDTTLLTGQLVYAFNAEDEIAPAQVLHNFAKTQPALAFVGAITAEGKMLTADEVKALAVLPSKQQLLAGIINTLQSPVRNTMSALSGNIHGYLQAIEATKAS